MKKVTITLIVIGVLFTFTGCMGLCIQSLTIINETSFVLKEVSWYNGTKWIDFSTEEIVDPVDWRKSLPVFGIGDSDEQCSLFSGKSSIYFLPYNAVDIYRYRTVESIELKPDKYITFTLTDNTEIVAPDGETYTIGQIGIMSEFGK